MRVEFTATPYSWTTPVLMWAVVVGYQGYTGLVAPDWFMPIIYVGMLIAFFAQGDFTYEPDRK